MYNETFSAVRVDGELSDWVVTIVGVLQGCVIVAIVVQHISRNEFLGKGNITFQIKVNGQQLQQIENCVYLGGNISTNDGSGKDIERRIGLARGMLQTLNRIWTSKELSKQTKMRVYETLAKNVLLYN